MSVDVIAVRGELDRSSEATWKARVYCMVAYEDNAPEEWVSGVEQWSEVENGYLTAGRLFDVVTYTLEDIGYEIHHHDPDSPILPEDGRVVTWSGLHEAASLRLRELGLSEADTHVRREDIDL